MMLIKDILEKQKEVQHLAYFVVQDLRCDNIELHIYTVDIYKKYKFRSEEACLTKLVDILKELKLLERWAIKRLERSSQRK